MAVSIRGIRLEGLTVPAPDGSGKRTVSGSYALVSTADKVLATQPFNQYGGMDISVSPATTKALDAFLASLKADIGTHTGIEGDEA